LLADAGEAVAFDPTEGASRGSDELVLACNHQQTSVDGGSIPVRNGDEQDSKHASRTGFRQAPLQQAHPCRPRDFTPVPIAREAPVKT
jgi:hypothetical protein